jgi:hypothetical protein
MAKFGCKVGSGIGDVGDMRFGWNCPAHCYDNIGADLGVIKLTNTKGYSFGGDPKPPRVRITYKIPVAGTVEGTDNDILRSVTRFCDTDKIGGVIASQLSGKKIKIRFGDEIKQYDIVSVRAAG